MLKKSIARRGDVLSPSLSAGSSLDRGRVASGHRRHRRGRCAIMLAIAPIMGLCARANAGTLLGVIGDGKPDFVYDPMTGDLSFSLDGASMVNKNGTASGIGDLSVQSLAGQLLFNNATPGFKSGEVVTLTPTFLFSTHLNRPGFPDGFDIGIVLPAGLSPDALLNDFDAPIRLLWPTR